MAISLAGLSAAYPGYSAQEQATAKTEETHAKTQQNQTEQREAAIKMLGAQALGTALAPGPQAPPPGQASVPAPRPMPPPAPAAVPPPPAPGPVAPPASSVPAAAATGIPGKLGLQPMIAQIVKANPGVVGHPEVLLAALTHAKELGVLDPEATAAVEEIGKQHTMARIEKAKGHLAALKGMGPQEAAPAAAAKPEAPAAPVVAPASAQAAAVTAAPTAGNVPPIATLKPNVVTTFANGQKWTVGTDGKPKQVQ